MHLWGDEEDTARSMPSKAKMLIVSIIAIIVIVAMSGCATARIPSQPARVFQTTTTLPDGRVVTSETLKSWEENHVSISSVQRDSEGRIIGTRDSSSASGFGVNPQLHADVLKVQAGSVNMSGGRSCYTCGAGGYNTSYGYYSSGLGQNYSSQSPGGSNISTGGSRSSGTTNPASSGNGGSNSSYGKKP